MNYLSLDWTLLQVMVKCRSALITAHVLFKGCLCEMHFGMRSGSGDALGTTRASLPSYGLGSGNTLLWKSMSVHTLLVTVQGYEVAYLLVLGKNHQR